MKKLEPGIATKELASVPLWRFDERTGSITRKFVFADLKEQAPRAGFALDSLISQGCLVSGGRVERSILSPNVRINSWADVRESILLSNVTIGRHAHIRRAIIDKGVQVPEGMEIGFDHDLDRQRGFTVTDSGLVVIAKSDGSSQLADLD